MAFYQAEFREADVLIKNHNVAVGLVAFVPIPLTLKLWKTYLASTFY